MDLSANWRNLTSLFAIGVATLILSGGCGLQKSNVKPQLHLDIRVLNARPTVGDEIPVEFTVTNIGKTDATFLYDMNGSSPMFSHGQTLPKPSSFTGSYMDAYPDSRDHGMAKDECTVRVDVDGKTLPDRMKKLYAPEHGPEVSAINGVATLYFTKLAPGQGFTKTILLNRHVLLDKPGVYKITGTYRIVDEHGYVSAGPAVLGARTSEEAEDTVTSQPISFVLYQASTSEKSKRLKALLAQFDTLRDNPYEIHHAVERLEFTGDRAALITILNDAYRTAYLNSIDPDGSTRQIEQLSPYSISPLLHLYFPADMYRSSVIQICKEKGFALNSLENIDECSPPVSSEDWRAIVLRSLAPEREIQWGLGIRAAAQRWDDSFVDRLVAIAKKSQLWSHVIAGSGTFQLSAISAMTKHPTAATIEALKSLLDDPDARVQELVRSQIIKDGVDLGN